MHTSSPLHPCLVAALLATGFAPAQTNTLLILADDVGVDAVTAYKEGTAPPPTPNIDALAKTGVLFRNAYANPICSPTRATLFTGRYCLRTGVGAALFLNRHTPLAKEEYSIAEVLGNHGFATSLIGKWHLTDPTAQGLKAPNDHGWSHFAGHMSNIVKSYYSWDKVVDGTATLSTVYATTDNVNDAVSWIGKQSKPWLCCVSFNAAHTPFHAPPQLLHTYNLVGKDVLSHMPLFYKAMVQAMDTEIGRLLKSIGPTVLKKTNVIFIGDNGTPLFASQPPFLGRHAKTTLYEGGINVPLIISGPGIDTPGREVSGLAASVDIFATILDLAGVDPRKTIPKSIPLDGVSLVPILRNKAEVAVRDTVYVERFGSDPKKDGAAVLDTRFKLIRFATHEEFYDLVADPFEKNDLLKGTLSRKERQTLQHFRTELDQLVADSMPFGSGCPGRNGEPRLELVDGKLPRRNQTFETRIAGLDSSVTSVFGFLGASDKFEAGLPLPIDLGRIGMPTCSLLVSMTQVVPLTAKQSSATWQIQIPSSAAIGTEFFQQAFVLEPNINSVGLISTHANRAVIGER